MNYIECESTIAAPLHLVPSREELAVKPVGKPDAGNRLVRFAPAPRGPVVCLAVKPVGKPDAGNRLVRFGNAIEASQDQKRELIEEALRYLQHARIQEQREREPDTENSSRDDEQDQYRQVRQLIKQALEIPTPEQFVQFLDFTTKFVAYPRGMLIWRTFKGQGLA